MRKFVAFIEQFFNALFRYSRYEQRGMILLLGIAAAILAAAAFWPEPAHDTAYFTEVDRLNDSLRADYYRRNYAQDNRPSAAGGSRYRQTATIRKPTVYIELNRADSARLTTVRGIGPVIARNIAAYRQRLGGFVRKEQLREVWGVTDENFAAINAQFYLDTAAIQKINLNFATPDVLRAHPYFTGSMVGRIVRGRESEGGWRTLKELTDRDILLPGEAEKLAPYVVF